MKSSSAVPGGLSKSKPTRSKPFMVATSSAFFVFDTVVRKNRRFAPSGIQNFPRGAGGRTWEVVLSGCLSMESAGGMLSNVPNPTRDYSRAAFWVLGKAVSVCSRAPWLVANHRRE
jgi:hypothetical protein